MRWETAAEPKIGDKRIVKRFAFFPTTVMYSDVIAWWETIYIEQEFYYDDSVHLFEREKWGDMKFVTKEDYANSNP